MDLEAIRSEVETKATAAANKYLTDELGGVDNYPCGFAWVRARLQHKGNTKLGKAERAVFVALGFRDNHQRGMDLWMPGRINAQNVGVHEAAAKAAVEVLTQHGLSVYMDSRLD